MWDDLDSEEIGKLREEELKTHYWYPMISQGSEAIRYLNNVDSAWKILDRFLDTSKERLKAIQLQKETVKQQKSLSKTDAGQELYSKLDELDKKRRSLIRKLEKQIKRSGTNEEIAGILQRQHDELEEQRKQAVGELQSLKMSVPQRFLKAFTVKMRYRWVWWYVSLAEELYDRHSADSPFVLDGNLNKIVVGPQLNDSRRNW